MPDSITRTVKLSPELEVTVSEAGSGRPVLILHGGGGPFTMAPIVNHLAASMHTIMPTHPGWNGTPRPAGLTRFKDLAQSYLQYLENSQLSGVVLIGSSLGGWIASEMAVADHKNLISGLVLIDAVGVAVEGEPVKDIFTLAPQELANYSFHDAERYFVDPANDTPVQATARRANQATVRAYAGEPYMHNPDLESRLKAIQIPVLFIWGESDRISTPTYGQAYARAFKNAEFETVKEAGHLPQIEQPAATFALIDNFLNKLA